jgi:hypothetical protein
MQSQSTQNPGKENVFDDPHRGVRKTVRLIIRKYIVRMGGNVTG